jgi:PAS domain S-box-containing protein
MKQKDGSIFYGEFSVTSYYVGGTKGTLGVIRDITHRKLAEEALYQSVQRFRDISEATGEFIWETDARGKVTYLSNRFEQILGFTSAEAFGKTPFSFLERNDAEWNKEFWMKEPYLTKGVRNLELLTLNKSGKSVWLSVAALPIFDQDGKISGFRGAALDITERKLAAEALQESLEEKIALLKEVHHRVKNNLQIVISMLNLQAHSTENPSVISTLLDTQNRVRSMALLHEALYTSGNLARINFSDYVGTLCAHLYRSFGIDRTVIGLDIQILSVNLPIEIAIPCGLIINELVSNSLKHAFPDGSGGKISITITSEAHDRMCLFVSDDGIGIPEGLDIAQSKGLGLRLIINLAKQLGGVAKFQQQDGTACSIEFNAQES